MLIECFNLQKETLLNEAQDMSQKKINRGVLIRFIGNPYVHQTPENNFFIAAGAIGANKVQLNLWIYLLRIFLELGKATFVLKDLLVKACKAFATAWWAF